MCEQGFYTARPPRALAASQVRFTERLGLVGKSIRWQDNPAQCFYFGKLIIRCGEDNEQDGIVCV